MKLIKYWNTFSSSPHRMFFFGGVVQSILTLTWWITDLAGRYGALYLPISWTISPTDAHAFLMIYGFFPFFIFGFLMTTFPRWMNGEEVKRSAYVPAFLLLFTGALLTYAGLIFSLTLLRIALILFLIGWGIGLHALLNVYLRAGHPDKRHAMITSIVMVVGWMLVAGFTSNEMHLVKISKVAGIWVILLPVFFAVSHRMIPFFSANIIPDYKIVRPDWVLVLIPSFAMVHGVLELTEMQAWTWLVDLPMAASAIYLSRAWRLQKSLTFPILGMLHIGFAWFGAALILYTIQSLDLLITGQIVLSKAPLHALTIGYFSSILLAMATRVTLGHSGMILKADSLTWRLFLIFQSVAVLRIIAETPGLELTLRGHLYICAGVIWLLCFSIWLYKYAPIYWRPREDGGAG
jgi:uncharacterized protein involved in response to NO